METAKERLQWLYKELLHKDYIEKKEDLGPFLDFSIPYTSQVFFGDREISDKFCERIFNKVGITKQWIKDGKGKQPDLPLASSVKPDNPDQSDYPTIHESESQTLNEDYPQYELSADLQVRPGRNKDITLLGKNPNQRLKPEEFAGAFPDWQGLPIYNSPITASFIATYRDEKVMQPYYYLHDPRFKDCDFGAIITGDSMYPEIRHGDIVICKEIQDKSFIVYGDIYYITARNGLETCKYVNGHDNNEDMLMLVPRNDSIKPSPIKKEMLLKLYKLRGLIRGY